MSWQCGQRIVADPTWATVSGTRMAGSAQVRRDVAFRLVEWPWEEKGPLSLVPQPSEGASRAGPGELRLGFFLLPAENDAVPDEEFNREDADLRIQTTVALVRIASRWGARDCERDTKESS